jgi:hypothetical protein
MEYGTAFRYLRWGTQGLRDVSRSGAATYMAYIACQIDSNIAGESNQATVGNVDALIERSHVVSRENLESAGSGKSK